ncbi:hypothetical protein O3G_MSEX013666 [Manduca sexta]|uniref:ABC transporter domain-containing protein n=1 Tax=Manduca sexta TaxID=7130 RepID=A0A922CYA3_MANSE|nr:hypothetical protein O3G_MSEX013666 [Manduca sexta]KAG6463099.1 hypothetical protein O3G_MSEX013666 [Manduca sexta]
MNLVSMPVSPLMEENKVRKALSGILLCITVALIPPVLETEALVVKETFSRFKRAICMRNVLYSSMYIGWLAYAFLTVLPLCLLAAVALILIFRWIHLLFALLVMLAYVSVMMMLALIMAMFHSKAWIACVWTTLFTLLQMYLAELLVHHHYDLQHGVLTFILHVAFPPLGLINALNLFALLQTGRSGIEGYDLLITVVTWTLLIVFYFGILMLLQRTLGQERAIGGQVSWKTVVFKKVEDVNTLRRIETPTGRERERLQEVDELVAKAISFRNVSKSIMGVSVLKNITMDVYRGEFTLLFAERIQEKMVVSLEDLFTGLTYPDKGTINVLGRNLKPGDNFMTEPHMVGFCHRSRVLVEDLTVQDHFTLFTEICLWRESNQYISEYGHIRSTRLLSECDLESVKHERVKNLSNYYKAQLCWAIAMLMEPRIVVMPNFTDQPRYIAVIKDKIMQYRKYLTIVKLTFSSSQLEYADRVFLFDNKVLVFGGTPAYLFFKYGREYRVRMTLRSEVTLDDDGIAELLQKAKAVGATVRAHLGSLLILRLPASPTANVAAFVRDITDNANSYGMTSLNISLPDPEEICRRAMADTKSDYIEDPTSDVSKEALKKIAEPVPWKRVKTSFGNLTLLRNVAWKYFSFYVHYRLFLIITLISTLLAGAFIGLSLSSILSQLGQSRSAETTSLGEILTVEALEQPTTLVLRSGNTPEAQSIANAYVLSEPNVTEKDVEKVSYTALSHTESLTEYLVTRAIDSPQHYVYMYAYGMDVSKSKNGTLIVQALYSPLHFDNAAAARSLARAYMALLRHYTGAFDASIQFTDDPLILDLTHWKRSAMTPPLLIQFLLILTICHITLIPSREYGLVRHMQKHAMNFSPARYWFMLYFCDLILYWILVGIMTVVMIVIIHLVVPGAEFHHGDLLVVPFMLIVYGIGCVPQAYIFSLGRRVTLNSMTFVIVNMIFGETTILAKIFYGNALNYALQFLSLSPQFNMAYAFVKIKQIFLYNSECIIFKTKNLCTEKSLHICCQKCGIFQECYSRKSYLSAAPGIMMEVIAILSTAIMFTTILFLIEYKIIQRIWISLVSLMYARELDFDTLMLGADREKKDVLDKKSQIRTKRCERVDTFGEYLLAANVSKKHMGVYTVRDVFLGLGKGEALAISGLKRHGRLKLCEMLAGYKLPSDGRIWCMSKWSLDMNPHKYARNISISCQREPLPSWMTVYDALEMIAMLRGVPRKHVRDEIQQYIDALELNHHAHTQVSRVLSSDLTRLHFVTAVIGAPPIIILDECTAYQKMSVRRAMYFILYHLRKRGHAICMSSNSVESHMPITNRLAIMLDGRIFDIDSIDNLVERYSNRGYTVVVHLKDEVDIPQLFSRYFRRYVVNDVSEVLINIQVLDSDLNWSAIFEKMEQLKADTHQVYSYIVSATPIDYIYNSIINNEKGNKIAEDIFSCRLFKKIISSTPKRRPKKEVVDALLRFEQKYCITKLKDLPWSIIFQR